MKDVNKMTIAEWFVYANELDKDLTVKLEPNGDELWIYEDKPEVDQADFKRRLKGRKIKSATQSKKS